MAIEFSDVPAIQKIYFSLSHDNAEQAFFRSLPPEVTNNLLLGYNMHLHINTKTERNDFESLYSNRFVTPTTLLLTAYNYFLSCKNRLYHISYIRDLPISI